MRSIKLAAAMAGNGQYNRHSGIQAAGINRATFAACDAAQLTSPPDPAASIIIADYGSSQGRNSLFPIGNMIRVFRENLYYDHEICVIHTDLPDNDFNTLFSLLDSGESYADPWPNIYSLALGKSFYKQILPKNSVTVGWSSFAVHWLSDVPALVGDHISTYRAAPPAAQAFSRQASQDWETFLLHRSRELRHGGRLIVVGGVRNEKGFASVDEIFDLINDALVTMRSDSIIRHDEYERMIIPDYTRTEKEFVEPIKCNKNGMELLIESSHIIDVGDALWQSYEKHGQIDKLADEYSGLVRSVWIPSLMRALDPMRTKKETEWIATEITERFRRRIHSRDATSPLLPLLEIVLTLVKR